MGNYYSNQPVEPDNEKVSTSELKIFDEVNTDFINEQSTQTSDNSDYNILLEKFKKLEIEKKEIQEELDLFKQKYDNLILKIDSEEIIKQIIKKIN